LQSSPSYVHSFKTEERPPPRRIRQPDEKYLAASASGGQAQTDQPAVRSYYQPSFSPNCICREVVNVEVMTPALGEKPPEVVKVVIIGHPKLV